MIIFKDTNQAEEPELWQSSWSYRWHLSGFDDSGQKQGVVTQQAMLS